MNKIDYLQIAKELNKMAAEDKVHSILKGVFIVRKGLTEEFVEFYNHVSKASKEIDQSGDHLQNMIDERLATLENFKKEEKADYKDYCYVKHSSDNPFSYGVLSQVKDEINFLKQLKVKINPESLEV